MHLLEVLSEGPSAAAGTGMQTDFRVEHEIGEQVVSRVRPIRLVCLGPLNQRSGAVEFFAGLCTWADYNVDASLDIIWMGSGILQAVLRAQPSRPNVRQRFVGIDNLEEPNALMRVCNLVFATGVDELSGPLITTAVRLGLTVIHPGRHLTSPRFPGGRSLLHYDPLRPHQLAVALNRSLASVLRSTEQEQEAGERSYATV